MSLAEQFDPRARAVVFHGACEQFLATLPDESMQLVVTSPSCNLGKSYEKRVHLDDYVQ